jgi:hypothetical protein
VPHSVVRWPLVHYRLELYDGRTLRPFCSCRRLLHAIDLGQQLAREGAEVWVRYVPGWWTGNGEELTELAGAQQWKREGRR